MAVGAGTNWEIRRGATAGNVNGGGFNTANPNFPTDLTTDTNTGNTASPVVSSASYNFVAGDVGNWLYVQSGTDWTPGWYEIASVASNKATLLADVGEAIQVVNGEYVLNTVAGVATVGTPTSGVWSVDYSQNDACNNSTTNDLASTNGTTNPSVVTSASYTFGVNTVGNLIRVSAGTSWTQTWHEIVSVSGGAATLDKAAGSAATLSSGTWRIGGALSMQSTLDDAALEIGAAGNIYWWQYNASTYALGVGISVSNNASTTSPIKVLGYTTNRGDSPAPGGLQPRIIGSTNQSWVTGQNWVYKYLDIEVSGTNGLNQSVNNKIDMCSIGNVSTTANRIGVLMNTNSTITNSRIFSIRGIALSSGTTTGVATNNYIQDSNVGFNNSNSSAGNCFTNNIIARCVTTALDVTGNNSGGSNIFGNTIYGTEAKIGAGVSFASGAVAQAIVNNIIYGFVTGVSHAAANTAGIDKTNVYYNNTDNVNSASNWQIGPTSLTSVDPDFVNATEVTGAAATTSNSGNTLSLGSATFVTSGVTARRDFVHITATSGTVGKYQIASVDSETQITLVQAPGNSTGDVSFSIGVGHDFNVNGSIPGSFGTVPFVNTTGYQSIGAMQKQSGGGASGSRFTLIS